MVEILEEIKEEKVEKVPSSETKREDSQDSASRTDDATDNDGWISLMGKDIQLKVSGIA